MMIRLLLTFIRCEFASWESLLPIVVPNATTVTIESNIVSGSRHRCHLVNECEFIAHYGVTFMNVSWIVASFHQLRKPLRWNLSQFKVMTPSSNCRHSYFGSYIFPQATIISIDSSIFGAVSGFRTALVDRSRSTILVSNRVCVRHKRLTAISKMQNSKCFQTVQEDIYGSKRNRIRNWLLAVDMV